MRFSEGGRQRRSVLLDISPLIDVVFLLLIFFMVSTTFTDEAGLPLDLPSSVSRGIKKVENVVVTVTSAGEIYIGKARVDSVQLADRMKQALKKAKKKDVIIKADKDARYELVYQVMDASRQAGASGLSVAGELKQ